MLRIKRSFLALIVCLPLLAQSQEYSETELLVLDLLTLSKKFATPGAEAAMYQSSAGWYTSAETKDLWEVDFSLHGNFIFLPEKKKTTQISNAEFNVLTIQGGAETATIPTALGGETDVFYEGEFLGSEFDFQSLEGIQKQMVAYPFLQASVGVPYGTNLSFRFLPLTEIKEVEYKVWGVALQHNLNQHFSEIENSDYQFAGLVGYSWIGVFYPFEAVELPGVALNKIKINGKLLKFQLIASKKLNNTFELFSAVGITNGSFNYQIGGRGKEFLKALNSAYEKLNASETMFKADLGFNLNFQNFTVNSVFSVGEYLNYNLSLHYKI